MGSPSYSWFSSSPHSLQTINVRLFHVCPHPKTNASFCNLSANNTVTQSRRTNLQLPHKLLLNFKL